MFDDAVNRGEPQAGSLTEVLRGKEGFEDLGPDLRRHPGAGVGHDEASNLGGGQAVPRLGGFRGGDREGAALGHRIAGIHGQVHHDLFELAAIDSCANGRGGKLGRDRHAFAEHAAEQSGHLGYDDVQVDDFGPGGLSAAEREQLPNQTRGPFGCSANVGHEFRNDLGFHIAFAQQLGVAVNHGEQVVEVVGDSTGEPADRVHLLRFAQLRFEPAALGGVAENRNPVRIFVVATEHGHDLPLGPHARAVLAAARQLQLRRFGATQRLANGLARFLFRLHFRIGNRRPAAEATHRRVRMAEHAGAEPERLLDGVAHHSAERGIGERNARRGIVFGRRFGNHHPVARGRDRGFQQPQAFQVVAVNRAILGTQIGWQPAEQCEGGNRTDRGRRPRQREAERGIRGRQHPQSVDDTQARRERRHEREDATQRGRLTATVPIQNAGNRDRGYPEHDLERLRTQGRRREAGE